MPPVGSRSDCTTREGYGALVCRGRWGARGGGGCGSSSCRGRGRGRCADSTSSSSWARYPAVLRYGRTIGAALGSYRTMAAPQLITVAPGDGGDGDGRRGQFVCVLLDPTLVSSAVTRLAVLAPCFFPTRSPLGAYEYKTEAMVVRLDYRRSPYYFRNIASMET